VHNLSELYADAGTGAQTTTYSGTLVNNEYDTFDSLVHMTNLYSNGRKEFAIIARFRGRFFGEDRIVISSGRIRRAQSYVSYYDAYPPVCKRDSWEFYFPDDGSTIDGALYIDLNSDGEIYDDGEQQTNRGVVEDRGGADVASIDLVVAEMPDELVASWDRSTYRDITLEQLYSYRHRVFPFEVGKRDDASKVYPVRWGPIDPSGWDTGWYLIAIVASDEYGNRGICPFKKAGGRGYNTNPQHWRIVTGSVGL